MIEGRIIVCLASAWDYDPTSKHQIMKILGRRNDIVWVNYHGTRRPAITGADFKAGCNVLRRVMQGVRRVNDRIVQVTPFVLPGARRPWVRALHQHLLVAQIRRAVRSVQHGVRKPVQVWSFAPDVPDLVGKFGEECFLYYCVDEHSQFKGVDERTVSAAEAALINRAHVVITTSEALYQRKRALRADTVLVRHGVDYDRFAGAWQETLPRPADLANIQGPILGFFGLIDFWIDCELIADVARLRPKYQFVLIGDCKVDVCELRKLPNIHLLGRKPNGELPAYCAAFDAGLLPFDAGPMTRNVNPIKMYEYLAAGLPVISTPMPEAERFSGPIRIAGSVEQFALSCDDVLATDHETRRRRISQIVQSESWLSKVELLSEIVADRLNPGSQAMSLPIAEVLPHSVASPAHLTMMPGSPANLRQPIGEKQVST